MLGFSYNFLYHTISISLICLIKSGGIKILDPINFDEIHNRKISGDIKYKNVSGIHDVIPMWIADMDFKVPYAVEEALIECAKHRIFGYTETDDEYDFLVADWYKKRFAWDIKTNWILKTPAVMFAISAAINAFTEIGDSVLICQPVYYPFSKVVTANKRNLIISDLVEISGKYEFDYADIEKKIIENNVKIFLLCSPHNPVGRVWTKTELSEIGRICLKHNVIIVADEIHSDFIFGERHHIPIASISEEIAEITITCTAPTKTFNLAGLQASNIIVSNSHIRKSLHKACLATGYNNINTMAIAATKAVYRNGEQWLDSLLKYLNESRRILRNAFPPEYPITLVEHEGTYLAWLDCRKLGMNANDLNDLFLNKSHVWLHNGETFGKSGSGFMRMNFACPHSVLNEAIQRIKSV